MELTRGDLVRVFLRSLWLQASWSFEGMQSLGFAYAVEPALERLHGREEGSRQVRARHMDFFNTHPFLAAAILGCAVRMEEQGSGGGSQTVSHAKSALMGAYGALGDSFYWGGLKPMLALAALWMLARGVAWAPWAFLATFMIANLGGRLFFFSLGYRKGVSVVDSVNRLDMIKWSRRMKAASAVLLGLLCAALLGRSAPGGAAQWLWAGFGAGATGALAWLFGNGVNPLWAVYGASVLAAAVVLCT